MAWQVLRSRHPLKDRWISVRADDCVTERGVEVAPYYVYEYPDFVHALALDPEGRVVLVEQYRHGLGGLSLELPGGVADPEDSDPVATAVRELREETGYEGRAPRLVASLSVDPAKFANRLHLVVMPEAEPRHATSFDADEDIDVVCLTVPEVLARIRSGGVRNAAHVGLILLGLADLGLRPL